MYAHMWSSHHPHSHPLCPSPLCRENDPSLLDVGVRSLPWPYQCKRVTLPPMFAANLQTRCLATHSSRFSGHLQSNSAPDWRCAHWRERSCGHSCEQIGSQVGEPASPRKCCEEGEERACPHTNSRSEVLGAESCAYVLGNARLPATWIRRVRVSHFRSSYRGFQTTTLKSLAQPTSRG